MRSKIAFAVVFLVFLSVVLGIAYIAYARTHRVGCEACWNRVPGPLNDYSVKVGDQWVSYSSPDGPSPRYMAVLAFDGRNDRYLLFGGETATGTSNETWSFHGTRWTKLNPAHRPPPRRDAAMAWDPGLKV